MGGTPIGTTLPGDLKKQEEVIGNGSVEANSFIASNHILHAGNKEELVVALSACFDKSADLSPFPPLDGNATRRVVTEIMQSI